MLFGQRAPALTDGALQIVRVLAAFMLAMVSSALYAQTCAVPGAAGPQTVSANPNAFFPGATSVAAGATSISLGTRTGAATDIAVGDLLLIIQMQGAVINSTQTNQYGDGGGDGTVQDNTGDAARGSTSATAGTYEFAVASGAASSGGSLSLSAPLQNSYTNAAASGTQGQQRFQVIRVPQYSSATLSGTIQPTPWDGTSGGVLVMDVAGELALGGATLDASQRGFRGGGGTNQAALCTGSAGAAACTDYRALNANPANGAFKGEGIAGTPALTYSSVLAPAASGNTAGSTTGAGSATGADGYPNGDRGRGAPGNAGGGGNQHNGGGGGGGNGGTGGTGGNTWNNSTTTFAGQRYGGFGGANGYNSATRIVMGGGGGAGDVGGNNSNPAPGGSGGGIVMIRAGSITGTGTINVSGAAGVASTATDGSGGGGAGGTAWISTSTATLPAGLTVNANGGAGANSGPMAAGLETDGPGGGGGGGVLLTNATGGTLNSTGGNAGTMTNSTSTTCGSTSANPQCFATSGGAGVRTGVATPVANTGARAGAECLPDIRVTKSTTTPLIATAAATTANYSILLQNFGGGARNVTVLDNALPPGWTLSAAPTYVYTPALPVAANNYASGAEATNTAGGASTPLAATPLTVPAVGNNALTWRQFFIAPIKNGTPGSVQINMVVNIPATATVGCYHNPAGFTFLDPTRLAAANTREIAPTTNNGTNRTSTLYSANITYASGGVTNVAGNHYNGLEAGPAGENVCLQPDLSITKTRTGTGTLAVGGTDTYNLVARNNGRAIANLTYATNQATAATNGGTGTILTGGTVVVTDTIPTGVTIGTITPPAGWACVTAGQLVTCTYTPPSLPLAAQTDIGTIAIPVTATSAACPGPNINNTASVGSTTATYVESDTANNTSAAVSTPLSCIANVSISKSDTRTTVVAGNSVTYSIVVANAGPAAANGTRVSDVPSAGLTGCSVTACNASGGAVCPATANWPNLLTAGGVTIDTVPNGSNLTFSLACSVTATGNE